MPRTSLLKVILLIGIGAILAVIVAPSEGKPGEYTLTFPTEVHVLACTATINSGAAGTIYCGAGEDTGLNANQLKVLTTDTNNNPGQSSSFTVAAYSSPASSEQGSSGQSATKEAT